MSYVDIVTEIHTALSFIALALGIAAIGAVFKPKISKRWITLFLASAWATTLTGFLFPFIGFTPAFGTGIVSVLVLIAVAVAQGRWPKIYAGGIVMSEYLLVFVAIAQAFLKIEFFNNLAPTLSEPPFGIAQLIAIAVFGLIGFKTVRAYARS